MMLCSLRQPLAWWKVCYWHRYISDVKCRWLRSNSSRIMCSYRMWEGHNPCKPKWATCCRPLCPLETDQNFSYYIYYHPRPSFLTAQYVQVVSQYMETVVALSLNGFEGSEATSLGSMLFRKCVSGVRWGHFHAVNCRPVTGGWRGKGGMRWMHTHTPAWQRQSSFDLT